MSTRRPPSSAKQPSSKQSRKSKHRPRLNPYELSSKISTFFSPTLFPRLPPAPPSPPSLAYSRLPPPCAELDPAPPYRVRRFKLWRNQVVDLRKIVLDHRLRAHLVRYQTYALPNTSHWSRGVQRKVFPRGSHINDYSAWPKLSSIRNPRPSRIVPAGSAPELSGTSPHAPAQAPVPPKLSGPERRKARERLNQHRWVLHAENERRWRQCMRELMADVMYFQEGCMLDASKWRDGIGVWLPDYDLDEVIHRTNTFRDIRRRPDKVFDMCTDIPRVKGRAEADRAIKANEAERKARKAERRWKRVDETNPKRVEEDSRALTPSPPQIETVSGQSIEIQESKRDTSDDQPSHRGIHKPAAKSKTDPPAGGNSRKPAQSATSVGRIPPTPLSGPLIGTERPLQSTKTERSSRRRSDHRRSFKTPSEKQVVVREPAEPTRCMTKEDTSSLFRLLQHMADLQTKRYDLSKREEALRNNTAQKAKTRSGPVGLDGKHDDSESVPRSTSEVSSGGVEQSARSDKSKMAEKRSTAVRGRMRSGSPTPALTASSTTSPSIASSATALTTQCSLRPGSLNIDDDTLHPLATPLGSSAISDLGDEIDDEDLDVGALQVLIREILADGQ